MSALPDGDCQQTLDAVGLGVYRIDIAGNCTYANPAALAMLGYDEAEVTGRNMHALIHHSHADGTPFHQSACPLNAVGATGRPVRLSNETLWRKDGSFFTAEYSAWPIGGAAGQGAVVTFVDNGDQREWQRRLTLQLNVARILASANDIDAVMPPLLAALATSLGFAAAFYWTTSIGGETLRCEASWTRADRALEPLCSLAGEVAIPFGQQRVGRAWQSGEMVQCAVEPHSAADWVENADVLDLTLGLAFPVKAGRKVIGVIELLGRDAERTDDDFADSSAALGQQIGQYLSRRIAEEHLRGTELRSKEREAEFRALADNIPQLAWMADAAGAIYWYNQRWYNYTGTDLATMRGLGWHSVHHPQHVTAVRAKFQVAVDNGVEWEDTFPLRSRDGDYRWFLSRAVPIRDDYGNIARWFGTNTDVTEQRLTEAALSTAKLAAESANEAKSQFLASMSHELRTPLNAVIGYSEMLREDAEDMGAAAMLPDLDKIHRAGKTLLALVNDVLDLAKIEAGKMEIYLEDFAARELVEGVAETVRPLVEKNGNKLIVVLPEALGAMRADATKVRQILLNLLSNAGKFTDRGTITLSLSAPVIDGRQWARFAVTDTGIGMTAEHLGKLFQAFQQAEASTTRNFGGTGLGLALSRRLAQMMGGDISVASESGKGSTFTVLIPWAVSMATDAAGETLAADRDRPLVLVIDDDPDTHDLMTRYLEKEGVNTAVAASGEAGIAMARALKPAAITLDVMMPGIDGWQTLTRLKADPETAHIPVVMLSMVQDRSLGMALGVSDYLTKPIDRERLHQLLQEHLVAPDGTILIVEDDVATRALLRRILETDGYTVREAEHGRAALAELNRATPALILLDLLMPEIDGFELLQTMGAHPTWQMVPVIVVTSKDLTAEERERPSGKAAAVVGKSALDRDALLGEVAARVGKLAHRRNPIARERQAA